MDIMSKIIYYPVIHTTSFIVLTIQVFAPHCLQTVTKYVVDHYTQILKMG